MTAALEMKVEIKTPKTPQQVPNQMERPILIAATINGLYQPCEKRPRAERNVHIALHKKVDYNRHDNVFI